MSSQVTSYPVIPCQEEDDPDQLLLLHLKNHLERLKLKDGSDPTGSDEWDRFMQVYTRVFLKLVHDRHWPGGDHDDGIQELWLTLITRLPDFHYDPHRGHLKDWILVMARHRLADLERRQRSRPMERLARQCAEVLPSREADPAESFERKSVRDLVWDALTELRPQVAPHDFEAFLLHWFDGLTVQEISQRLAMTEGRVWSSQHRMSRKLRPLLAQRLGVGSFASLRSLGAACH